MSEEGDLNLKVSRSTGKEEEEEEVLLTMTRFPSKEIMSGHLICQPSPCTYSLVLDSNSVIRGKTILYKCDIEKIEMSNQMS